MATISVLSQQIFELSICFHRYSPFQYFKEKELSHPVPDTRLVLCNLCQVVPNPLLMPIYFNQRNDLTCVYCFLRHGHNYLNCLEDGLICMTCAENGVRIQIYLRGIYYLWICFLQLRIVCSIMSWLTIPFNKQNRHNSSEISRLILLLN